MLKDGNQCVPPIQLTQNAETINVAVTDLLFLL